MLLFCGTCHSVKYFAVFVKHIEIQGLVIGSDKRPACLSAAIHCPFYRLYIPAERTGSIDYIVYVAIIHANVLESMDVAAYVHVHITVFPEDSIYPLLHVAPFRLRFVCISVYRMVSDYDYPLFISRCKSTVKPRKLLPVVRF